MTKLAELEIPTLEGGWINLTEAADRLGYTRSYMYKKASRYGEPGGFQSIRKIGTQASYVVLESEVEDLLTQAREKAEEQPAVEVVVEEKPKRKPRAKKEKPVEDPIELDGFDPVINAAPQEDPAIHEIEPEPAPVTAEEPMPVVVEPDEDAPYEHEESLERQESDGKPAVKELSIDEILAQIS